MSASSQFVYLQAGIVVPTEAYELALKCEALGIVLADNCGTLEVDGPHTPEILQALSRNKAHILTILHYSPSDRHLFDSSLPFPDHGDGLKRSTAA